MILLQLAKSSRSILVSAPQISSVLPALGERGESMICLLGDDGDFSVRESVAEVASLLLFDRLHGSSALAVGLSPHPLHGEKVPARLSLDEIMERTS